jgi:hypothetical protein
MIEKLKESLDKIDSKDFQIMFLTPDLKGTPRASVAEIYYHVKELINLGYKASVLHENNEYTKVGSWLGEEYDNLPHSSIQDIGGEFKVGPQDFLIIPELFGNVIQQTQKLPCKRIVLVQSYDYILDMLTPGTSWSSLGVNTFVTTSNTIKDAVNKLFPNTTGYVVNPQIPDYFNNKNKIKKPIIAIMCRDERTTSKIVKSFYLKYPLYSFVTFRDIKQIPREELSDILNDYFLSVWVDEYSSFGTFPVESMMCGTPVIGKVPIIQPEWITEKNGVWLFDELQIPDAIAISCKNFFEDIEDSELLNDIKLMEGKYSKEEQANQIKETYTKIFQDRRDEISTNIDRFSELNNVEQPIVL